MLVKFRCVEDNDEFEAAQSGDEEDENAHGGVDFEPPLVFEDENLVGGAGANDGAGPDS